MTVSDRAQNRNRPGIWPKIPWLKTQGTCHCVCCDATLFRSQGKSDSGSRWPS
ncbi:peptide-methionine (R)-S-oxide reductase [Thiogranum longum]